MAFSGVLLSGPTVGHCVRVAQEAEASGYETGWYPEVQAQDAVTVLAAAAMATSNLKLATGIVAVAVRDPYLMALSLASLQDLSGGRVIAGFGTSTPVIVSGWHGLPFPKPVKSTRAYVELVKKLLAGERVKSEGEYTLRGASLRGPVATPVPIYLGALGPKMLELAGEVADGVILNFPTHSYAKQALEAIGRGLAKAGRDRSDIEIHANFRAGIGDFDSIANPLRRELIQYFLAPVYQKVFTDDGFQRDVEHVGGVWASGDRPGAVAAIPDSFVDAHSAIAGTAAEIHAKVQSFLDLGIDRAALFPVVSDGPGSTERYLETVRALAPG